jgi:serine/threonine protein kinase
VGSVVNGKYRILALVASGGMGKIYQAEQIALGRSVALKVLHPAGEVDGEDDPQFKKRFLREASILARLQHPNIVTIFDYGAIEGAEAERFFISMEYLSGETLARRISEQVSLTTKDTVRIARQIARGLTEAHAHGVIHRDLKPSNVMLIPGRDGEEMVKIVDFGIVKIVGDESQEKEDLTQEGSFIGSPKYMAPEQITRGGKIDARTDVYSFGVILYQCLTGTVPFDGASSIQTLMAHLNQAPQPIRERAPSVDAPPWLDELVMTCMAKEPEKRVQTMDAVAKTLAEAEAAMTSNRLMAAMSLRSSSPSLSGIGDQIPVTSRSQPAIRSPSGITTQGTISSVRPQPEETEKTRTSPGVKKEGEKKRSFLVPALVAAALVGGVGAFFGLRQREPPAEAAHVAPPIAPAAPTPAVVTHFAIRIESVPTGADVREGDRVLGTTPLELSVDNDSVRSAPRTFLLAKDGFAPYPVVQGPSESGVHVLAQLAPVPAAAASSVAARAAGGAPGARHASPRSPSTQPSTATTPSHPDLDIRMNR